MPVDPYAAYLIAKGCYVGGKFAYRQADERVAAWAERQDVSKEEVWAAIRTEAMRRGDRTIEHAADKVIGLGWRAQLLPGGKMLSLAAHGWKLAKRKLRADG